MKKLVALTMALVMTFAFGYVTMAGTIGIGANEGFTAEIKKQIEPSEDEIRINGYFGLNEQTQFSLGYGTDSKDITLGARYAFADNMAVTLDHTMADAEDAVDTTALGFRYKHQLNNALALVGVVSYVDMDEITIMGLEGQAEYQFNDQVVGNLGFQYGSPDSDLYDFDSYTNIVAGIQVNPIENVTAFLDYTMVDEIYADDDTIDLGVSYSF
jgi:opacity protein-like surface antigen